MTDVFAEAKRTLHSLEDEQRERYRPQPQLTPEPVSPAQAYLDQLNASCSSSSLSVDVGWLR